MKRLRKNLYGSKSKGKYFKHYAVGEYGDKNGRPHYHIILFLGAMNLLEICGRVNDCWTYGIAQTEECGIGAYGYVAGYIIGNIDEHYRIPVEMRDNQRVFSCMSKGLGEEYIGKWKHWHMEDPENRGYSVIEDGMGIVTGKQA